jgi:hypothetical protein
MIDADGFTDEMPRATGTYWACAPDGGWEELVRVEADGRGLVCVLENRMIPPISLAAIPMGSLLWRREG